MQTLIHQEITCILPYETANQETAGPCCCIEEKDTKIGKVAKGQRTNAQYRQYQIA